MTQSILIFALAGPIPSYFGAHRPLCKGLIFSKKTNFSLNSKASLARHLPNRGVKLTIRVTLVQLPIPVQNALPALACREPDVLQATLSFNQAIQKELDPKLRELAYLKTTQVNKCNY